MNRKDFIKQLGVGAALSSFPTLYINNRNTNSGDKIWAGLLAVGHNLWEEYISGRFPKRGFRSYLELDEKLWNDALNRMSDSGLNMVVVMLADGIKYDSHPEIAVDNAWTTTKLRSELDKIRELGLEPVPSLNFSATHDAWLKDYSHTVSSEKYYKVCRDLISETIDLFETPRFFHLGMDEEAERYNKTYRYELIRKDELWWNDLHFLVEEVEKNGSRAWIWSDYLWRDPDQFFNKMPKSVVQSNWYYGSNFDTSQIDGEFRRRQVEAYVKMDKNGYDQIPAGNSENISPTVQYCSKHISDSHLMGFLQTIWRPTIEENRSSIIRDIELAGDAKNWYKTHCE